MAAYTQSTPQPLCNYSIQMLQMNCIVIFFHNFFFYICQLQLSLKTQNMEYRWKLDNKLFFWLLENEIIRGQFVPGFSVHFYSIYNFKPWERCLKELYELNHNSSRIKCPSVFGIEWQLHQWRLGQIFCALLFFKLGLWSSTAKLLNLKKHSLYILIYKIYDVYLIYYLMI